MTLRPLLAGGDRRSQARSKDVLARVHADNALVAELVALVGDDDWLTHPSWIAPHKRVFIGAAADSDKWEVRLQVVRALPLFEWAGADERRVLKILQRDVAHPQTFVRAWALDSLATFASRKPRLKPVVRRHLRLFDRSGSKALAARARHIRERL